MTAYDTTPVVYGAASSAPDRPGKLMSSAWLCPAVLKVQEFFAIPAGSQSAFSREGLFEGWASRGDPVTIGPPSFTLSAYIEAAESDMRKPQLQAKSSLCWTAQHPISLLLASHGFSHVFMGNCLCTLSID